MRKKTDFEKPAEPPMTPMIDVIFQLLIFFVLTMQFKTVEGRLLSQLPRERGVGPGPARVVPDIRIVVCCGGDFEEHLNDKGRHDRKLQQREQQELGAGKLRLNDRCPVRVDQDDLGALFETSAGGRGNTSTYREIAATVKRKHALTPDALVIVDADSAVPYEHIIGIVNALKEVNIQNVEFVANPRHMPK